MTCHSLNKRECCIFLRSEILNFEVGLSLLSLDALGQGLHMSHNQRISYIFILALLQLLRVNFLHQFHYAFWEQDISALLHQRVHGPLHILNGLMRGDLARVVLVETLHLRLGSFSCFSHIFY